MVKLEHVAIVWQAKSLERISEKFDFIYDKLGYLKVVDTFRKWNINCSNIKCFNGELKEVENENDNK